MTDDNSKGNGKSRLDLNWKLIINFIIASLIITDTILLLLSDIGNLSLRMINNINYFDLFVCFALFCEFIFKLNKSDDKKAFLTDKYTLISIVAMIPINFFAFRLLRYIKIVPLIVSGLKYFNNFLEETHLNWSFGVLIISISAGTLSFYVFEHGLNKHIQTLWDSFLYVIPTVGSVGSTISPKSMGGEILGVILMLTGIICFGLFTASISAMFIKSEGNSDEITEHEGNSDGEIAELKSMIENMEKEIKDLKELLKGK